MEPKEINNEVCHICGRPGYKTDGDCNVWCANCISVSNYHNVTRRAHKIGRNQECPCGSKKKYKHCCINKDG